MPNTYTFISSVVVGSGGATSISFTNIPSTYTDLKLVVSLRSTGTNGTCLVYFNDDTTNSNYSAIRSYINTGGTVAGASYNAPYFIYSVPSSFTTNTFGNGKIDILKYTSSNQKSLSSDMVFENSGASDLFLSVGKWTGTSAINKITIQQAIDTGFVQYSTAYLYGTKNS